MSIEGFWTTNGWTLSNSFCTIVELLSTRLERFIVECNPKYTRCTVSCRDQKGFQTIRDFFPFMIFLKDLFKSLHGCDVRLQSVPCLILQFLFSQEHGYYEENHRVHFDQKYNIRFVLTFHSYKCVFYIMGAYKIRHRNELVWTCRTDGPQRNTNCVRLKKVVDLRVYLIQFEK